MFDIHHWRDRVDRHGFFVLILERKVQLGSSVVTVSAGVNLFMLHLVEGDQNSILY